MGGRLGRRWGAVVGLTACTSLVVAPVAVEARPAAVGVAGADTTAWARPDSAAAPIRPEAATGLPISEARVRRALGRSADDVSFSVRDRRTGRTYTYNGRLRNSTGSIVKVLVLATLLRERREDGKALTSGQKALAERMIRFSDNDATSSLFRQAGGSSALQRMADDLGMTRTTVRGAWGTTTTSAADQRLLIDRLVDGTPRLGKADRRYILGLMGRVTPEQRWGVGDVPGHQSVAVKNGWVPLEPRGWRVNSIGSVKGDGRDYTLAILSYDNSSMEQGVGRMRTVSGLVWRSLATPEAAGADAAGTGPASGMRATPPFWIRRGGVLPPHPLG